MSDTSGSPSLPSLARRATFPAATWRSPAEPDSSAARWSRGCSPPAPPAISPRWPKPRWRVSPSRTTSGCTCASRCSSPKKPRWSPSTRRCRRSGPRSTAPAALPCRQAGRHLLRRLAAAALLGNLDSCFLCCREAVNSMRRAGGDVSGGRIVNVAARPALEPRQGAGLVAYTAAKAGVAALTQALGEELAGRRHLGQRGGALDHRHPGQPVRHGGRRLRADGPRSTSWPKPSFSSPRPPTAPPAAAWCRSTAGRER